jgi:GTPase SAR1 family protein
MNNTNRETLVNTLRNFSDNSNHVSRKDIIREAKSLGINHPSFLLKDKYKVVSGVYDLTEMFAGTSAVTHKAAPAPKVVVDNTTPVVKNVTQAKLTVEIENLIPAKDDTFVPFGFYRDLKKVLDCRMFYPVFISGLSGNGKTTMVEQICANLKREAIRVNISIETDEDDLIGGNTLVDGNVVYREGPVLTAMKRGAVLILDEVDRGSNKLMCLQAVLEGKSYFNKKTGETITPANGFTIIATANTKGRGSDDGKFISAQLLDEAFLERFAITVEQEYPTMSVEKKIILNKMERAGCVDEDFATHLVTWSDVIRKTYLEGAIDELVSTRRLEHIVNAFAVFKDKTKAITLCTNRFDEDTKQAFIDLYSKVDPSNEEQPTWQEEFANTSTDEVNF